MKERARLRAAPSASADFLGWVPEGTTVRVLSESGGWREVQAADARGFVWGEHLAESDTAPAVPSAQPAEATHTGGSVLEEVRDLKAAVEALRARPEPATVADLDRLRDDLSHLIATQHDLPHHADDHGMAPLAPADPPVDAPLPLSPMLLVVGGVMGWTASRLLQRRRDRRQRNRLRL